MVIDNVNPFVVASRNVVEGNVFRGNDFDLFVNSTCTGNVVVGNKCSLPAGLCG